MRLPLLFFAAGLCAVAVFPSRARAQNEGKVVYATEVDPKSVTTFLRSRDGKQFRQVNLNVTVTRATDGVIVTDLPKTEIVVEEDGVPVANLDVIPPATQKLTVVLAIDVSGSMARGGKMEQARAAALAFLKKLDKRADVGLILFDHEAPAKDPKSGARFIQPPAGDPDKVSDNRERVKAMIEAAQPQGGTAYIDATIQAVRMLKGIKGRKIILLMTDGVDMNSNAKLSDAIKAAQIAETPVYTVGIGKPGQNEMVTTVLVLDRSGSMLGKADDRADTGSKIDALKVAAKRFVKLMRPGAKTIVQSFSTKVDPLSGDFTDNQRALSAQIDGLDANGGTALYAATYAGLMTLEARGVGGKRAVVVLTDGVDEANEELRRSDAEVIARAKELKVPLYMLGLGQKDQINEEVMQKMAKETGGDYYHAGSEKRLLEVFENLSIQLHDDGIDEESLKKLAQETDGKYLHVEDVSKLSFLYQQLADEFQKTYRVTYAWPESARQFRDDGTARRIVVKVVRGGVVLSTDKGGGVDYVTRRLAVPQMNYAVYLMFLLCLGVLVAAPAFLRRLNGKGSA
jgi:VWFA-related protein